MWIVDVYFIFSSFLLQIHNKILLFAFESYWVMKLIQKYILLQDTFIVIVNAADCIKIVFRFYKLFICSGNLKTLYWM